MVLNVYDRLTSPSCSKAWIYQKFTRLQCSRLTLPVTVGGAVFSQDHKCTGADSPTGTFKQPSIRSAGNYLHLELDSFKVV